MAVPLTASPNFMNSNWQRRISNDLYHHVVNQIQAANVYASLKLWHLNSCVARCTKNIGAHTSEYNHWFWEGLTLGVPSNSCIDDAATPHLSYVQMRCPKSTDRFSRFPNVCFGVPVLRILKVWISSKFFLLKFSTWKSKFQQLWLLSRIYSK